MTESKNTRLTLIERVKDRADDKSWQEFIEIYQNYVYVIVRHMNVPVDDCEDIVQQIFLKVWNAFTDFEYGKNSSKFRTWLGSVSHSVVYDYFRKAKRLSDKQERVKNESELDQVTSYSKPEIEKMVEKEWRVYISNLAMQNIKKIFSGKAIEAFNLSIAGRSGEEIAEQLDIKLETVYMLKSRVKKRLIDEINLLKEKYG